MLPDPPPSPVEGPCIRCGVPTTERFGGDWLCDACYTARGSCCPEFGSDDLTENDD